MFSPPDNIVKVLSLYSEKASLINGLFIYTFIYAIVFYVFVVLCTCVLCLILWMVFLTTHIAQ